MERFDVVVVGGGPGGSSCARGLVQSGLAVAVLDRRRFPRDKICAGWVTPQVFAALGLAPDEFGRRHVLQPIHGFSVRRMGAGEARVDYGRVISYGIRRCEFDAALLARSGATPWLGEPLRSVRRERGGWVLNERLRARFLVGAGGHFCPVAQHLGAVTGPPAPVVAAQELEFPLDAAQDRACPVDPALPELFFSEDLRGYGWLVRKDGWLNVGLGRQGTRNLSGEIAAFLERLRGWGRLPFALPSRPRGHAYLLHGEAERPLGAEGVLLVGDAAGLAYPRSGEGIRPAVESGLLAADAIAEGLAAGDEAPHVLYQRSIEQRFGSRRPQGGDWVARLPEAWKEALAGRLLATRAFARHVVLDRWFLHRHAPALPAAG